MVDGNNFALISHFAMSLSTSKGQPTQGVYGFLARLSSFAVKYPQVPIYICWDSGKEIFRKELLKEYKRRVFSEQMRERFKQFFMQLPDIKKLSENLLFNLRCTAKLFTGVIHPVVEADDQISFWVSRDYNHKSLILSSDKDFLQLVSDSVAVFTKDQLISLSNFEEVTGYPNPSRYFESRLLSGDSSDKIKGVSGVGEKTARGLLNRCPLSEFLRGRVKPKNFRERKVLDQVGEIKRNYDLMKLPPPKMGTSGVRVAEVNFEIEPPKFDQGEIESILEKNEIVSFQTEDLLELFRRGARGSFDR